MLPIFERIYKFIFAKKDFNYKIGDVVFLFPNKKSSERTKTILKVYGKNGFIFCEIDNICFENEKPSIKLLSRQYLLKFDREKGKLDKKLWLGWIPLEEINWIKKTK